MCQEYLERKIKLKRATVVFKVVRKIDGDQQTFRSLYSPQARVKLLKGSSKGTIKYYTLGEPTTTRNLLGLICFSRMDRALNFFTHLHPTLQSDVSILACRVEAGRTIRIGENKKKGVIGVYSLTPFKVFSKDELYRCAVAISKRKEREKKNVRTSN